MFRVLIFALMVAISTQTTQAQDRFRIMPELTKTEKAEAFGRAETLQKKWKRAVKPRIWTSGKYEVRAVVVKFADSKVRLKKANDELVSIDFEKLSNADHAFLEKFVELSENIDNFTFEYGWTPEAILIDAEIQRRLHPPVREQVAPEGTTEQAQNQ